MKITERTAPPPKPPERDRPQPPPPPVERPQAPERPRSGDVGRNIDTQA